MNDTTTSIYAELSKYDSVTGDFEGFVSSAKVDVTGQIVDPDWLKKELPPWLADWGNIRGQHRPDWPIGTASEVDLTTEPGPKLRGRIVDEDAKRKAAAGVFKGLSIGVKSPRIVNDATAPNGRIVGGKLIEISLVDRPANEDAKLTLFKAVGQDEWKDMQTGIVLAPDRPVKTIAPDVVKCDLPGCNCTCKMGAPDPDCTCQCDECVAARKSVGMDADGDYDGDKIASPDYFKFIEADLWKREFSAAQRKALASKGHALPDGSYPIENTGDLHNAIQAIGRAKNPGAAKRHIIKRARALGATNLLPADWSGSTKGKTVDTETAPVAADVTKAKIPRSEPSHAHPFKGAHNHTHDGHGGSGMGTHTHAHMHDDDDMHDHAHVMGKDSRLLSPEDRQHAYAMYAADPSHAAVAADAKKAAGDFDAIEPSPSVAKPGSNLGSTVAPLSDVVARLEGLADETDEDRDGDVDFPQRGMEDKVDAPANFTEDYPSPNATLVNPTPLDLGFAADPDLVKALGALVKKLVAKEVQAYEQANVTKQADTMKSYADVTAMSSDLAKGLGFIASRLEADAKKMVEHQTALESVKSDLEQVKKMAAPVKGDAVVVDKTVMGNDKAFAALGQAMARGETTPALQSALAKMTDQERLALAVAGYSAQHIR